jgi:hypothetical protein
MSGSGERVSYCCVPDNLSPSEVKGYILRTMLEGGLNEN